MHFESKLPDTGVTIFSVMTALANAHGAINLSQGFPNFDVHPDLIERVGYYMRKGYQYNQYALMPGAMELRQAIAVKVRETYGADYDPVTEITVTSGATEAVFAAISTVVRAGEEVIVVEPAYDAYVPAILLSGGVPVYVALTYPDYRIDWEALARRISERTRLIILNSPHNPSGAVLMAEEIEALKQLVAGRDIFILSDEVYEHIIFDGMAHESMARHPELARRSFVISSFGKTYHTTGWKIGYCLAPKQLSQELQKVHQYLTFSSSTPMQYAYADILERRELYLDLADFYQQKRDLFLALTAPSKFKALPCKGTYFLMLDYSGISQAPDMEFAKQLTVDHGVAAIPPSVFYHDHRDHHVLRFCFAKDDDTLKAAARRLCRI